MSIWMLVAGLAAAVALGALVAGARRTMADLDRFNAEDDGDYLA